MTITNSDDVIDSRDVIERIAELEGERDAWKPADDSKAGATWEEENPEDAEELAALKALADEAENSPDWKYGDALIREYYFVDYIKQLIEDCYDLPKEFTSGNWPYRHITIDYEAAAEEAKQDYFEVDYNGVTYLIRA